MTIQFYCPRWGNNDSWELFCKKVKDAGYDGIEYAVERTTSDKELEEAWDAVGKSGLKIIAQHYDTFEGDFVKHMSFYGFWLDRMKIYPMEKLNSQTGKDYFSFEQNKQLIEAANATGLKVVHETHRGKFSFAAHVTKEYLQRIPELRITLDASHWVCVAESLLEDQQEAIELAIEKTDHIHARVGYPEGPQVPDPRVQEWNGALEKHLSWWDKVVDKKTKKEEVLTITTEFGPFPYNVHQVSQWEINVFMMELLRKRYQTINNKQIKKDEALNYGTDL